MNTKQQMAEVNAFLLNEPCGFSPRAVCSRFAVGCVLIGTLLTACDAPPAVNPWRDDSISADKWSTPSQDGVLAAGHEPALRQREIPVAEAPRAFDDVPHYPLWWEDPFEDKGDGDGVFAWTWADYLAMPYSYGRFLFNSVASPVSVIVTPPGTAMVSDGDLSPGLLGYDHDAAKGFTPEPTAERTDFFRDDLPPPNVCPAPTDEAGETPGVGAGG